MFTLGCGVCFAYYMHFGMIVCIGCCNIHCWNVIICCCHCKSIMPSRVISSIDKPNRIYSIDFKIKMTLLDPTRFLHLHFCDYLIYIRLFATCYFAFWREVRGGKQYFAFHVLSVITWIDQTNPRQASTTDSFICSEPTTCEAGWIPWGTSCYGIIRGLSKTWKDARSDCLRRFGDLLIINSIEEQNFLTNEIATDTAVSFNFFPFSSFLCLFIWPSFS